MPTEKHIEIENYLNDSGFHHLAECMYMVDDRNLDAIARMIDAERKKNTPEGSIRYQVTQDMASFVSGYIENPLYCAAYINKPAHPSEVADQLCDKCGNNCHVIVKVSIPNTDLQQLCGDCKKTMEMYAGTVGIL